MPGGKMLFSPTLFKISQWCVVCMSLKQCLTLENKEASLRSVAGQSQKSILTVLMVACARGERVFAFYLM